MGPSDDRSQRWLGHHLVEEVGPQGEHDPDPAQRVGGGGDQGGGEGVADVVVGNEGEELLELVDDDDEVAFQLLADSFGDPEEPSAVGGGEFGGERRERLGGEGAEGDGELVEGITAWHGSHADPGLRSRNCASGQGRQQTGQGERGLARPRRADDRRQPVLADQIDQPLDLIGPAEEVGCVLLGEGRQAFVGVASASVWSGRSSVSPLPARRWSRNSSTLSYRSSGSTARPAVEHIVEPPVERARGRDARVASGEKMGHHRRQPIEIGTDIDRPAFAILRRPVSDRLRLNPGGRLDGPGGDSEIGQVGIAVSSPEGCWRVSHRGAAPPGGGRRKGPNRPVRRS